MFLLSAGTLWAQQAAGLLPVQEDTHCKEWVEQTLSRMKLKDKVGQLFVYTLAPRADDQLCATPVENSINDYL